MDVEKIVQTVKKRIKEAIKVFVSYTIEDDVRIYRLKHTPFQIRRSLTDQTKKEYGSCPVNPKKIVFDNYMGHGYGCNCKYVTEELLKRRKDLELVWIVKNVRSMQNSSLRKCGWWNTEQKRRCMNILQLSYGYATII